MRTCKNYAVLFLIPFLILIGCTPSTTNNDSEKKPLGLEVKDFDGNSYQTVKIGSQIWMKENLKVTHYRNGDPIPVVRDDQKWANLKYGAQCNYNNDNGLVKTYGKLYNWYAVADERNLCPAGWHVPSDTEFAVLDQFCGGITFAGSKLKEAGNSHWKNSNSPSTNETGFTGLPGGHREASFSRLGTYAFFWNKNEYTADNCSEENACAQECSLNFETSYFNQDWGLKNRGMSVRCIKDKE